MSLNLNSCYLQRLLSLAAILLLGAGAGHHTRPEPAGTNRTEVFMVAHADDWQLFMGDVAAKAIRNDKRTVFVYTTATDAGGEPAYWQAQERAALASVAFALGRLPADGVDQTDRQPLRVSCIDTQVMERPVHRCSIGPTVSYFLRLPDGNLKGEGFAATGCVSLDQLYNGRTASLTRVDGSGSFGTWDELVTFVTDIVRTEAAATGRANEPVRIHAPDPDTSFNPKDHADHRATGRLAAAIARTSGWSLTQYAGYSIANWPSNISAAAFADKAALFMAYDRMRILANPEWSTYALLPKPYSAFLSRTYVRPPDFTGQSQ